jgi:hypothetical protein
MARRKYPAIPSHIRITAKRDYEVTYIDNFKDDPKQLGECRWQPPQIVIKQEQPAGEKVSTCIHECIHSLDFELDIKLTETQVLKLERGIFRMLKLNGWI